MDTGILLESGTNELEILEFTLAGNFYRWWQQLWNQCCESAGNFAISGANTGAKCRSQSRGDIYAER